MLKRGCALFALQKRCIIRHVNTDQGHFLILYGHDMSESVVCVLQVVSEKEYKSWLVKRQEALAAIDNRETLVMDTAVQLENNLSVLGTSARHIIKTVLLVICA